jgi:hypothetical protein
MTTTTINNVKRSFEDFDSPEHKLWQAHRDLLLNVPAPVVGSKGCVALGLMCDLSGSNDWVSDNRNSFVLDRDVKWLTLQTLPRGKWTTARRREVDLAAVRHTTFKFGLPSLCGRGIEQQFDFRRMPFDKVELHGKLVEAGTEVLNSAEHPQLFRAFNALSWAMTTTAFAYRRSWMEFRGSLDKVLGTADNKPHLLFGDKVYHTVPNVRQWMPTPYVAFPAAIRDALWDRCTSPAMGSMTRVYTDSFKYEFLRDLSQGLPLTAPCDCTLTAVNTGRHFNHLPTTELVFKTVKGKEFTLIARHEAKVKFVKGMAIKRGDIVATDGPELPKGFGGLSLHARWHTVGKLFAGTLMRTLQLWFYRRVKNLIPGYVHLPVSLCSLGTMGNAVDSKMYWEISKCDEYYSSLCEAFIFPTLRIFQWDDLRWGLPGEVEVDLMPNDARFVHGTKS